MVPRRRLRSRCCYSARRSATCQIGRGARKPAGRCASQAVAARASPAGRLMRPAACACARTTGPEGRYSDKVRPRRCAAGALRRARCGGGRRRSGGSGSQNRGLPPQNRPPSRLPAHPSGFAPPLLRARASPNASQGGACLSCARRTAEGRPPQPTPFVARRPAARVPAAAAPTAAAPRVGGVPGARDTCSHGAPGWPHKASIRWPHFGH
jgi:hypothetical protein